MTKESKYSSLTSYLNEYDAEQVTLTFAQVSNIVGGLPSSAYQYPALWSNSGHLGKSWMNAGFKASLDIRNQKVTFKKFGTESGLKNFNATRHIDIPLKTSSSLDINTAIGNIRKYYRTTREGDYTRFRSWEHCYRVFHEYRHQKDKDDFLCLHLAIYLASWGMLRNSFLLDMDYLVHMPVVKELTSGRFERLFNDVFNSQTIPLVLEATGAIQMAYHNKASDTLITKVLLGVFGCAPAYDQYFKAAARKYRVCSGQWGKASLEALWDYYETYYEPLEELRQEFSQNGVTYPPMKIMDMCLWQIGFDENGGNKKEPENED